MSLKYIRENKRHMTVEKQRNRSYSKEFKTSKVGGGQIHPAFNYLMLRNSRQL